MKRMASACLFALTLLLTISLAVVVPRTPVTSPPGSDVTLSCSFSYKEGAGLRGLLVTWQRPPADRVVHSFYYGRDQLDLQNEAYRNRTQLFPEQLSVGNASLRLKQVRGEDEGLYTCAVTNQVESSRGDVQLLVAAEFNEPRLTVDLAMPLDWVVLRFSAWGGYPEARVERLNETGQRITQLSHTNQSLQPNGCYSISSSMVLPSSLEARYTFVLIHSVLEQRLTRNLTVTAPPLVMGMHQSQFWILLVMVPVTVSLLMLVSITVMTRRGQRSAAAPDC
ncbi:CD276 antigen-like [Polyodon spathula]|uniref:CD276 antigen-like n=1 Tax=Polyodon spathula TaxID=7913 RepID=UPI001B7E5F3B|nr:CD276 antigen-like [Polyodon spathula]